MVLGLQVPKPPAAAGYVSNFMAESCVGGEELSQRLPDGRR